METDSLRYRKFSDFHANSKSDPESSSGLNSVSCRTLDVRHKQIQNSKFTHAPHRGAGFIRHNLLE